MMAGDSGASSGRRAKLHTLPAVKDREAVSGFEISAT